MESQNKRSKGRTWINQDFHPVHDAEPTFCCCEFIDQYGQRTHLSDASSCDDCFHRCCTCTLDARKIVADIDDRLRLPQFNGAVHAGFDGTLPALLLPLMGSFAAKSPLHALVLVVAAPPLLAYLHILTLRARRQPRFFLGWTMVTFVYGNLTFTLRIGEHVPFTFWLLSAVLQGAAAVCASATRTPPRQGIQPASVNTTCRHLEEGVRLVGSSDGDDDHDDDDDCSKAAASRSRSDEQEETDEAPSSDAGEVDQEARAAPAEAPSAVPASASASPTSTTVRCAFCGVWVSGYDHHCIWLNACIGRHNLGVFMRGCVALLAALTVQGTLCLQHAISRGVWGVEAVMALYALLLCLALLALLSSLGLNLARGLTAYDVRYRRRRNQPLPTPTLSALMRGLRGACCA